jgi:hypothetical protein
MALTLRALFRHRLDEAERRSKGHCDRCVASRQLLEHQGVQHGRLVDRCRLGRGDRLDEPKQPGRSEKRRLQRRRFVRRTGCGSKHGAGTSAAVARAISCSSVSAKEIKSWNPPSR